MQQSVRDALIAFMSATAQAQAEATKAVQRAGIEHAQSKANDDCAYLGRKPIYTREQFAKVRDMLGQAAVGIAHIAKEAGLTGSENFENTPISRQNFQKITTGQIDPPAWLHTFQRTFDCGFMAQST